MEIRGSRQGQPKKETLLSYRHLEVGLFEGRERILKELKK
jgi:hypothetical protein